MTNSTHVAVAIVGYRNVSDIQRCLAALAQSTHTDFEVVICENGGPEAYADLTASVGPVLPGGQPIRCIAAGGNLGYAGGLNVCLRATPTADAWWILNPDTVPQAGAMAALAERLTVGDRDAVGGVLHDGKGVVQTLGGRWRSWLGRAEAIGHHRRLDDIGEDPEIERSLSFLSGASMMVSPKFRDIAGYLREDYFLYAEEVEWCLRGVAKGLRLGFTPHALVAHNQGSTTGSAQAHSTRGRIPIYLDERNKVLVTWDTHPERLFIAAPAAFVFIWLRYARRGAWRQLQYGLQGWMAGLRGERGVPSWLSVR